MGIYQRHNGPPGILKVGGNSLPAERLPVYDDGHGSTYLL
jgi:hypothetical protein